MDREVGRMSDETPLREHGAAPRPLPRWLVASIVTVLSAVAVLGWIYGPQQASDAAGSPDVLTAAGLCESGGPAGHDHSQQGPPAGTSPSPDACHQDGGGPEGSDFVNILTVSPNVTTRPTGPNASTGSFVSECGRNENNHRNPDNFITSPGVSNGAHHTHDYVGNVTTSAFSTNESLAAGDTNSRAQWTCRGFDNRVTTKYPICPGGGVRRVLEFPSCWNGKDTDSANHRTHIVFPADNGQCPKGTQAVPRLRMTLTYVAPPGRSFAVDSFPEQKHNPLTDHADFANVMSDRLMALVAECINTGEAC